MDVSTQAELDELADDTPTPLEIVREDPDAAPSHDDEDQNTFGDLGLCDWLTGNCASLGLRAPTPVQRNCIPAILAGKDVLGTAQTGSGKTATFALPILQALAVDPFGTHNCN